jgi:hypothetical protein
VTLRLCVIASVRNEIGVRRLRFELALPVAAQTIADPIPKQTQPAWNELFL